MDRKSLGISSDSLLDSHFTNKLCSPHCYDNCPNIVDLFSISLLEKVTCIYLVVKFWLLTIFILGLESVLKCHLHMENAWAGVFLPKLCEAQGGDVRREMAEIRSSGFAVPGPESGVLPAKYMAAPTMAPF